MKTLAKKNFIILGIAGTVMCLLFTGAWLLFRRDSTIPTASSAENGDSQTVLEGNELYPVNYEGCDGACEAPDSSYICLECGGKFNCCCCEGNPFYKLLAADIGWNAISDKLHYAPDEESNVIIARQKSLYPDGFNDETNPIVIMEFATIELAEQTKNEACSNYHDSSATQSLLIYNKDNIVLLYWVDDPEIEDYILNNFMDTIYLSPIDDNYDDQIDEPYNDSIDEYSVCHVATEFRVFLMQIDWEHEWVDSAGLIGDNVFSRSGASNKFYLKDFHPEERTFPIIISEFLTLAAAEYFENIYRNDPENKTALILRKENIIITYDGGVEEVIDVIYDFLNRLTPYKLNS